MSRHDLRAAVFGERIAQIFLQLRDALFHRPCDRPSLRISASISLLDPGHLLQTDLMDLVRPSDLSSCSASGKTRRPPRPLRTARGRHCPSSRRQRLEDQSIAAFHAGWACSDTARSAFATSAARSAADQLFDLRRPFVERRDERILCRRRGGEPPHLIDREVEDEARRNRPRRPLLRASTSASAILAPTGPAARRSSTRLLGYAADAAPSAYSRARCSRR